MQGSILGANLFAYCENNPINKVDYNGKVAYNIVGAVVGAIIGAVGGYFLAKWIAGKINFNHTWQKNAFIAGFTAVITASSAVIGYFIGPYIAKAWSAWTAKLAGLIKGSFKQIAKFTANKMNHILASKHNWGLLMKKVTSSQVQTIIYQGVKKGTWTLMTNGTVKITYKYAGKIIEITGKVINDVFHISDAWVK